MVRTFLVIIVFLTYFTQSVAQTDIKEVFEHFYQPKLEIDRLISLLNKNGELLIMTWLYDNTIDFRLWNYRNDDTHVFIYRKETFLFIAKKYNLEIDVLTDRFIVLKN